MYAWRAKIGLIVPSPNTVAEVEIRALLPEGVEAFIARCLYPETTDVNEKYQFYLTIDHRILQAAKEVACIKPDLIVWACTLGSLLQGNESDVKVSQMIQEATGFPAITTTTAIIEYLQSFHLKRIIIVTPYPRLFTEKVNEYLVSRIQDLEILDVYHEGIVEGFSKANIPSDYLYKLIMALARKNQGIDGIFISCTNWPSLTILDYLEQDTGFPIVTSNLATAWFTLKKLGISSKYGRKISTHGYVRDACDNSDFRRIK
jgi:maleate isomerase